jgi:hypothetical protein
MATVYAATHPVIGRRAAIKVISPELGERDDAVARFTREARAIAQVAHPNVVDVFGWGTLEDGRAYFVMEQLEGATLGTIVAAGLLDRRERLEVIAQICDALEAAHDRGVVHRDLKPDNVVMVGNHVKLVDFGIALVCGSPETPRATRPGTTMGTPEYLSPEQARGRDVDHRTDVYALGVMCYELLTGKLPFEAGSTAELVAMHLLDAPRPPRALVPDLPVALEDVILRMLSKDPAARPTLAQVRAAVLASGGDAAIAAPRRWPPRAGAAALAAILLSGAALLAARDPGDGGHPTAVPVLAPAPLLAPAPPPPTALTVSADAPGAEIRIDGEHTPDGRREVAPGEHVVTVSAPGRRSFRTHVTVRAGEVTHVPVTLPRAAPPRPRPRQISTADDLRLVQPW